MIGAIAGDIIGSVYEFEGIKSKQFDLFSPDCCFTDDTVLTVALAESILTGNNYTSLMRAYYRRYPDAGYGGLFHGWARAHDSQPYNSWGNGAAMRISSVGFAFDTLDEVLVRAAEYTAVTHNHMEGIKGAQATAAAIFLARTGTTKAAIKQYTAATFHYVYPEVLLRSGLSTGLTSHAKERFLNRRESSMCPSIVSRRY